MAHQRMDRFIGDPMLLRVRGEGFRAHRYLTGAYGAIKRPQFTLLRALVKASVSITICLTLPGGVYHFGLFLEQ